MSKELLLIYQDCYKCGPQALWQMAQDDAATENGYTLAKKSFALPGVDDLIKKAAKKHIGLPFITDGKYFGNTVKEVLEKANKAATKATKKTKRSKKVDESAE